MVGAAFAAMFTVFGIAYSFGAFFDSMAAVGSRFMHGRTLAVGLAWTGIGLGTLLVPPEAAQLIAARGWRTGYLVLAVAGGCVLVVAAAAGPMAGGGEAGGQLRALVPRRQFQLLYAAGLLTSMALFVAFVHLAPFARHQGARPVAAALLISVIGAGSIAGRIGLGALAGRFGALRTYQFATAVLAGSFLVWLLLPAYPGLVAFAALLGFGYGGWVALSPSVVAELFGAAGLGASVGAIYTSAGIGTLIGPWLAGALVDMTGTYTVAVAGALVFALAAVGVTMAVRPDL